MTRVGLVLGGGGITGQGFHAGVLAGIEEATGFDPGRAEIIVGTSAGAYLALLLRAGISSRDIGAAARGLPQSPEGAALLHPILTAKGIPPPSPRPPGPRRPGSASLALRLLRRPWELSVGTVSAALLPTGRRSLDDIAASLRHLCGDTWPEEALWICVARLVDARRVVFGRDGDPTAAPDQAVIASCAVPGFFTPVVIDGVPYVDGGTCSATNLDLLTGLGLDLVLVSAPMSSAGFPARPSPLLGSRLIHRAEVVAETARVRRLGTRVVAFEPGPVERLAMGPRTLDGSRRAAVTTLAMDLARRRLAAEPGAARLLAEAAGGRARAGTPTSGAPTSGAPTSGAATSRAAGHRAPPSGARLTETGGGSR